MHSFDSRSQNKGHYEIGTLFSTVYYKYSLE